MGNLGVDDVLTLDQNERVKSLQIELSLKIDQMSIFIVIWVVWKAYVLEWICFAYTNSSLKNPDKISNADKQK